MPAARFHEARSESKTAIFHSLFDKPRAQAAHLAFERSYGQLVARHGLFAVPEADDALRRSVLPASALACSRASATVTQPRVLDALGWWDRIDLPLSPPRTTVRCPTAS